MNALLEERDRSFHALPMLRDDLIILRVGFDAFLSTRWLVFFAEAIVLAAILLFGTHLPLGAALIAAITLLSSVFFHRLKLRFPKHLGLLLLFDLVLLTGFLAQTGGASNPFSVLYLVYVTVAASFGSKFWSRSLFLVSACCFAALFFYFRPLPPVLGGHGMYAHQGMSQSFNFHLQGMWFAYVIAGAGLVLVMTRAANALRMERQKQERAARLLSLAALAAGAAHEIGNPLGTIRLVATELERNAENARLGSEVLSDVRLINEEVERATRVLGRMSSSAGQLRGEGVVSVPLVDVLDAARTRLREDAERLGFSTQIPKRVFVTWPVDAVVQVLEQILKNALDASAADKKVLLSVRHENRFVWISIHDEGPPIPESVLVRIGEPFFTTKEGGTGLGYFVAKSLVEHLGGQIEIASSIESGTEVLLCLPLDTQEGVLP